MQVINNTFGIYQAIIANTGIGVLPEYFVTHSNCEELYIFKENMSETPYFLAYQPSYIAKQWATLIKDNIIKSFEDVKSSDRNIYCSKKLDVLASSFELL